MEEEKNYSASLEARGSFPGNVNYSTPEHHPTYDDNGQSSFTPDVQSQENHKNDSRGHDGGVRADCELSYPSNQHQQPQQQQLLEPSSMCGAMMGTSSSPDHHRSLSFADVMQFADFGPKLGLNHPYPCEDRQNEQQQNDRNEQHIGASGSDPVNYMLKFPVLSNQFNMTPGLEDKTHDDGRRDERGQSEDITGRKFRYDYLDEQPDLAAVTNQVTTNYNVAAACSTDNPMQLEFLDGAIGQDDTNNVTYENFIEEATLDEMNKGSRSKRKRPRTIKTSEEVESQRMTHIAVERNRRKEMNEHLRVLRSLMPSSYVQRGDQASIIGGAIEFVRELEQLLQCLESQKRRRLYGDQAVGPMAMQGETSLSPALAILQPANFSNMDQLDPSSNCAAEGSGLILREETAESKSSIADVEVKKLGFDALIKVLSRRHPGQLIKAIAALEELQFTILHTNVTTIEHTVLYSFNIKVATEVPQFTAEDIANSVQQIFTYIHADAQNGAKFC